MNMKATDSSQGLGSKIHFSKMHGLGNDFMVIDLINQPPIRLTREIIATLADRHCGIGFDQLLVVAPPSVPEADFDYLIYNADGNEVEQCGNGARCFMEYVYQKGLSQKDEIVVNTLAGIIKPKRMSDNTIRVNMGSPKFSPADIPFNPQETNSTALCDAGTITYSLDLPNSNEPITIGALSMGNPHAVVAVDSVDSYPVEKVGPSIESHHQFPEKVNAGFIEVVNASRVKVRVYERGVGETQACGTGACAAAVYALTLGVIDSPVTVSMPGGDLIISWNGQMDDPVYLQGPATLVYDGVINLP